MLPISFGGNMPFDKVDEYTRVYFIVDRGELRQHFFLYGHYAQMGVPEMVNGMPMFLARHIVSKWNYEANKAGRSGKAFATATEAMKEWTRQSELGEEGKLF